MTVASKTGEMTFNPSTAERTEIAGVMMPSPKNRQAPAMPTSATSQRARGAVTPR